MNTDCIKIVAVGDIFLGESSLKLGRGVTSQIKNNGNDFYIDNIKTITSNHDVCFGNLETVLSYAGRNSLDVSSVEMRGDPRSLEILTKSGFNVLNIANNHIFQHGLEAYVETISLLNEKGIKVVGDEYFKERLQIFTFKHIVIGFIGFSLHYEQYRANEKIPYALKKRYEDIISEIHTIKKWFNGTLICSLHWGYEFLEMVSCEQRDFCRNLIELGVSVILGHHPHVLQTVESYKGAIIAYSLGNFIFDMGHDSTTKSLALSFTVNSKGVECWNYIPFEIDQSSFCPYRLNDNSAKQFEDYFMAINRCFQNEACINDVELTKLEKATYTKISYQTYIEFFKNIYRGNIYYTLMIIIRALLRRIGILHNP